MEGLEGGWWIGRRPCIGVQLEPLRTPRPRDTKLGQNSWKPVSSDVGKPLGEAGCHCGLTKCCAWLSSNVCAARVRLAPRALR